MLCVALTWMKFTKPVKRPPVSLPLTKLLFGILPIPEIMRLDRVF
jgi:hypothetical protein